MKVVGQLICYEEFLLLKLTNKTSFLIYTNHHVSKVVCRVFETTVKAISALKVTKKRITALQVTTKNNRGKIYKMNLNREKSPF